MTSQTIINIIVIVVIAWVVFKVLNAIWRELKKMFGNGDNDAKWNE